MFVARIVTHLAAAKVGIEPANLGYSWRVEDDSRTLSALGYRPELDRRMSAFSNFAVGFSIICILSGGINSMAQGISAMGGAAIGLGWAPSHEISRLWTFHTYTGSAGGDVWPETQSPLYAFGLCLLFPLFTITGYDAAAHTAEETRDAARTVPRSIVSSVGWASLFGWIMLAAFVVAIPDLDHAAGSGWNVFFATLSAILPAGVRLPLYAAIFVAQALCGLATVTSASRMLFAFARDGGLPASAWLRRVDARRKTPGPAIWVATAVAFGFTLHARLYATLVSVAVIFLYLSAALPIGAALFAHGRSWTKMGPFRLGRAFRPIALGALLAMLLIFYLGVQPPNEAALHITGAFVLALGVLWFARERRRFRGPPAATTRD